MAADAQTRAFNNVARYQAFLEVAQTRMTNRAFATWNVPREHFEMILEAARHAPSGANAQPWHYIVVTDPQVKQTIGQCFVDEQQHRARLRMGFPTPNYNGVKTAPGLIVVVADFRFIKAFPVLNDGSELDRLYKQNAERILLQSVAASTMSAHLAAAALGYAVWWITAIGQEDIQRKIKPLLGVPDELAVIDVMCFGPPLRPSYKRWKKRLDQIMSWERFDPRGFLTDVEIEDDVEALPLHRLEVDAVELVALRIVGQRIGAAGIVGRAELHEYPESGLVARGLGSADVDGSRVEVGGVHGAVGGDLADLQHVAAVGPEPAAFERLEVRIGGTRGNDEHPRDDHEQASRSVNRPNRRFAPRSCCARHRGLIRP